MRSGPGALRISSQIKEVPGTMEFLNFLIILSAAWLVFRRPEREGLAFGLLLASCVLTAVLFLLGTRGSLLPGVNL